MLDGGIGMRSEVRDGVYTGRPAGPFTYREGKAEAIRELAAERGIDLSESYAYSDSESDLPMLRAVGHPVAVNPDSELERVAREEGWRIMRFDKLGRRLKVGGGRGHAGARGRRRRYLAARARPRRGGFVSATLSGASRASLSVRYHRHPVTLPSRACATCHAVCSTARAAARCRCRESVPSRAPTRRSSRRSPPPGCQSGNTPSISSRNRRTPACPQYSFASDSWISEVNSTSGSTSSRKPSRSRCPSAANAAAPSALS